jgi:hypothetical protein
MLDQVSRMIDGNISRQLARRSDRTKDLYVALIRAIEHQQDLMLFVFATGMRQGNRISAFRAYAGDRT